MIHAKETYTQHAGVAAEAICNVTCLGPARAAGSRCIIDEFRTVKATLAAVQATSAHKIYLDDGITKAQ